MKIETHHIPSKGCDLTFEEPAAGFESLKKLMDATECDFVSPIKFDLNIMPMRDFIRVKGSLSTMIRQSCVRCLGDFYHGLNSRFTLNYSKQIPNDLHGKDEEKEGIELTAQQIGIIFYSEDKIDFTDALQEQVVLAMPYKPLCNEDCMGLCSQCGQDLNKGNCKCRATVSDGPFAVLSGLKLPPQ